MHVYPSGFVSWSIGCFRIFESRWTRIERFAVFSFKKHSKRNSICHVLLKSICRSQRHQNVNVFNGRPSSHSMSYGRSSASRSIGRTSTNYLHRQSQGERCQTRIWNAKWTEGEFNFIGSLYIFKRYFLKRNYLNSVLPCEPWLHCWSFLIRIRTHNLTSSFCIFVHHPIFRY